MESKVEGETYYNPKSRTELIDGIITSLKEHHIQAVGVWGLGGGGTTSLAKQVREKVKEQGLFDEVGITTTVEAPNVKKIQQYYIATAKKILVIIDDTWGELNAQKFDLEKFEVPLGGEFKLLITSGNLDFIKNMRRNSKVFELEVLLEDEALSLFDKIVRNFTDFSTRSLVIEIIRSCGGSTLSTFIIAKALRGKDLPALQEALKQLKQNVSPIKIFLDSLESEELKYFFLRLTIRGGRPIHKSSLLLDMWVGLFLNLGTLEAARIRRDWLINEVKAYGLVVEDEMEWVKIIDSVWETAYSIAQKDLKALIISGSWPPEERLRNLRFCSVNILSGFQISERLPCPELEEIMLHTQIPSMQVSNSFFEETKLLKVLDFVGFDCSKLPISIGLLKNIQVLSMSNCKLGDITIFGVLTKLEMLSLQGSHIQQLPRQIGQLQKLRFLDLRDTYLQVIPPNVLANLTSLEELYLRNSFSNWKIERSNDEKHCASLKELTNLHRLVHIEDLYVPDHQAWPMDLFFEKLKSYTIFIGDGWGQTHDGDHGLKTLKLKLNIMLQSEEGIKKMLKVVDVLYLDELNGVQNVLSDLDNNGFPCLQDLVVQHNAEIKCIAMNSSHSLDDVDVFPNLKSLSLYNLSNLEHICHGFLTEKSFFKLRVIKVYRCDGMAYLFSNSIIKGFPHLVDIEVSKCKHIKVVLAEDVLDLATKFHELLYLTLEGLPELISFRYDFHYFTTLFDDQLSFDKLKVLRVINNQHIEQLWHESCPPNSFCELEDLTLSGNDKLLSVISDRMIMRFNKLKKLIVHRCKSLTTAFNYEEDKLDQVMHTMFPRLVTLALSNLCSLRLIWYMAPKFPFFQSLVSLHIVHCSNLKSAFSLPAVKNLTQLKLLKLYNCEKLTEVIEGDEDENLPITFPKVECLILKDLPNLVSFNGQSKRTFNWSKLQTIRVSNVRCMVTFGDGHLNTPLLRTVWVSFVKRCWHGDLNKTIRQLNGYTIFKNLIFFEGSPYGFSDTDLLKASTESLGGWDRSRGLRSPFKTTLNDGTIVVVRKCYSHKANWHKVVILGRTGCHPNVMPLRAYCCSKDEILLVYDYMPEGSLFHWLHGDKVKGRTQLDWDSRVKIALGAAKGIAFVHSDRGLNFTHGNIKSTDVFITKNLDDACISDVGWTALMNASTSGTKVYRAPEVTEISQITRSSDVYSFGVLLLEMLIKSYVYDKGYDLPRWVLDVIREESSYEDAVFDEELGQQNVEEMVQMIQIALACTNGVPDKRPRMEVVVRMIEEIKQPKMKSKSSSELESDVKTS